jgi:catechol 2,3-dioxygenase-like lactoylglutathione lyase family enzyme
MSTHHRPAAFALHHVQLAMPAGAEAAARAFYAGVLGLAELAKPAALAGRGGVWFRAGALELHLGVEDGFRPARKAHPGILVEDLDGLAARLHAHGVQVHADATLPGYRRFYLDDCFGNRLEFLSPAHASQPPADPVTPAQ